MFLTVDGSLDNPYAAGAVGVWTIILSVAALWMVRSPAWRIALPRVGVFASLLAGTRPAQHVVGRLLYWISDRSLTHVDFLGGPPVWIGPAVSCVVALGTWFYIRASTPVS